MKKKKILKGLKYAGVFAVGFVGGFRFSTNLEETVDFLKMMLGDLTGEQA